MATETFLLFSVCFRHKLECILLEQKYLIIKVYSLLTSRLLSCRRPRERVFPHFHSPHKSPEMALSFLLLPDEPRIRWLSPVQDPQGGWEIYHLTISWKGLKEIMNILIFPKYSFVSLFAYLSHSILEAWYSVGYNGKCAWLRKTEDYIAEIRYPRLALSFSDRHPVLLVTHRRMTACTGLTPFALPAPSPEISVFLTPTPELGEEPFGSPRGDPPHS